MQLADTIGDPYANTCAVDKTGSLQFDTTVHDSSIAQGGFVPEQHGNSSEAATSKMDNSSSMLHRNEQQSHIDSGITHQIQTNLGSCNEMNIDMHNGSNLSASQNIQIVDPMTNLPSYNQHQESHSNTTMATKNSGDSMGPSMGVYTPDSATNSVHSLHGSNGNSGGGMNSSYASQNSTVCSGEVGAHGHGHGREELRSSAPGGLLGSGLLPIHLPLPRLGGVVHVRAVQGVQDASPDADAPLVRCLERVAAVAVALRSEGMVQGHVRRLRLRLL